MNEYEPVVRNPSTSSDDIFVVDGNPSIMVGNPSISSKEIIKVDGNQSTMVGIPTFQLLVPAIMLFNLIDTVTL